MANTAYIELIRSDLYAGLRRLSEENPDSHWLRASTLMNIGRCQTEAEPSVACVSGLFQQSEDDGTFVISHGGEESFII